MPGIGARAAETWANRVEFWETFTPDRRKRYPAASLSRRVGVAPGNKRGRKLIAVHALGRAPAGLSPREVADRYFGGTSGSRDLGESQVPAIDALPLVGAPSARFIIRNMGGESIKDDRWLTALMKYFCCGVDDLARAGRRLGWQLGKVDLVLGHYCASEVGATKKLAAHFRRLGFAPSN